MIKILSSGLIEVDLDEHLLSESEYYYNYHQTNNKHSILKGKGNLAGYIGEQVFHAVFLDAVFANTYDYDFTWKGMKVDIKTKNRTVDGNLNHSASIAAYSPEKQDCDSYIFISLNKNNHKAWIMGGIRKHDFISKATLFKQGDNDPDFPAFTFPVNTYNLKYSELNQLGKYYRDIKIKEMG